MKCRKCKNRKSRVVKSDMRYNVKIRTRVCLRCDNVFRTIEKYWEDIIPGKTQHSPAGELPFKKRK